MKKVSALLIISCFIILFACKQNNQPAIAAASTISQIDSVPGSCPYLTKDQHGNTVLSWVREINDSSAVFCYAVSTDGGNTFGHPIIIPSSTNVHPHSENIPKVLFKPSGEIIAAWGSSNPSPKNKYAGMVYYAHSLDGGKSWSAAKPLVNDTAGFDQRYFDMALLPGGEAAITWLDNRKVSTKEGSALYFATTNGRGGFQGERRIQQQCCQCCRTDLFIDKNQNIHILYRGIIHDTIRDMVHTVSTDGGKTFTTPQRINDDNWVLNACPHTGPAMAENNQGLHFTWYTGGSRKGSYYKRSINNGQSFEGYDSISVKGSHPQLTSLHNGELVIAWDETLAADGRLRSRIGLQRRDQYGKRIANHYLAEDTARVTYPVLAETKNKALIIAFCQQKAGKNYVVYQQSGL